MSRSSRPTSRLSSASRSEESSSEASRSASGSLGGDSSVRRTKATVGSSIDFSISGSRDRSGDPVRCLHSIRTPARCAFARHEPFIRFAPMKTALRYTPQCPPSIGVPSLLDEAWRLRPFVPPFAFSAFFSPEDTLLCVCAADAARQLLYDSPEVLRRGHGGFHIAELTSGSGLVGLYLLGRDCNATLLGLDIDADAKRVAEQNARLLGLAERARFGQSDLWSSSTQELLDAEKPQLVVCNPPYVPEPPGTKMQLEAGAGPNGTAHLLRTLELANLVRPDTLALSWCSLSDPARIVAAAESRGYALDTLFVTAIADGEYSEEVHPYLRRLRDCFINEQSETLEIGRASCREGAEQVV